MEELRDLLRDGTASPITSVISILNGLELREKCEMNVEDHRRLAQMVCLDEQEGTHKAYLGFLKKYFTDLMEIPTEIIDVVFNEGLVRLADGHPSTVLATKDFFTVAVILLRASLDYGHVPEKISHFYSHALTVVRGNMSNSVSLAALAAISFCLLLRRGDDQTSTGSLFHSFILLFRPAAGLSKNPMLMGAALNVLGHVIRQRPEYLAKGIPVLLEWFDTASPKYEKFSPAQKRNLEHSLKNQLNLLLSLPEASPFVPILSEPLSRRRQQKASAKREVPPQPPAEEQEETYSKRLKPSSAFAEESAPGRIDVMKVSLPDTIKMVMKACSRLDKAMLEAKLEAWRPTSIPAEPSSAIEDPRKRSSSPKEQKGLLFKKEPVKHDFESVIDHLKGTLERLLDGGSMYGLDMSKFGSGRRKEWAHLVVRLATIIQEPSVESHLIDYVFQDLSNRSSLLILWLRVKWTGQDTGSFDQAFIRILSRIESLVEIIDDSAEDVIDSIGDILCYTPGTNLEPSLAMFFLRGLGLADQPEQEEGETPPEPDTPKHLILFQLIKRLLTDRPACRQALSSSLLEVLLHCTEASVREMAYKLCADTMELVPLGDTYKDLAVCAMEDSMEDPLGLFTELISKDISLLSLIDQPLSESLASDFTAKLSTILEHLHQREDCETSISSICFLLDAEKPPALLPSLLLSLPPSLLLHPGILDRLIVLFEQELVENGISAVIFEKVVTAADGPALLRLLPYMVINILTLESPDSSKSALTSHLLQLISGPSGITPSDIFVTLHIQEARLGIKKCIEACNVCFAQPAIWKPDVLLSSLDSILAQTISSSSALPTTYMRSVIQALTLHPKSLSHGIQSLLSRILTLRPWDSPRTWEGWTRACRMLLPASLPLLLQLPLQHAQAALESMPEAKEPLRTYLMQQPPSLRNRFISFLE